MKIDKDILLLQNKIAYAADEQAYKQLFFYFHPSLFRFANSITKSTELSDEIVADVMLKIWEMGNKLAYIDNLKTYLYTAVKNTAFTYITKEKQRGSLFDKEEDWEKIVTAHTEMTYASAELSETEMLIEKAVAALPSQCQLVFRLIREEGFSYKDVGDILQISQNTIETHMRIALKKIRLHLEKHLL